MMGPGGMSRGPRPGGPPGPPGGIPGGPSGGPGGEGIPTASPGAQSSDTPSLSGTQVPNEKLTQKQREERAQKLGFLGQLNKSLFPEEDPRQLAPGQHPMG